MALKSKKNVYAKSASFVAQTAVVQEKEETRRKSGFSFPGVKTKHKDGEKKGKRSSWSKGKGQAEDTLQEKVRDLMDSPGPSRHGLAQPQTTPMENPPEGVFYPTEALKLVSGPPLDPASGGPYPSMAGFDKLEPKHQHPFVQVGKQRIV